MMPDGMRVPATVRRDKAPPAGDLRGRVKLQANVKIGPARGKAVASCGMVLAPWDARNETVIRVSRVAAGGAGGKSGPDSWADQVARALGAPAPGHAGNGANGRPVTSGAANKKGRPSASKSISKALSDKSGAASAGAGSGRHGGRSERTPAVDSRKPWTQAEEAKLAEWVRASR